ncbi:MAG: hypothetical protein AAF674_21215 [Pseudomonadota bacterium]
MARSTVAKGMAAAALLTVAGCGDVGPVFEDVGTLWGEPSTAELEAQAARQAALQARVPILAIRTVEMGRTRDGFLITAIGTAAGLGYSLPTLRPRRGGAPGNDGFIEYDFVAVEPDPQFNLPPGTVQARQLRADLPVRIEQLQGARGLRVLSLQGGVQLDF